MRPTSRKPSVDKVDVDLDAITSRRGANDSANALRGTATTADDSAEIAGTNLDLELQTIPTFDGVDMHGFGIVDDGTNDMGEHGCCGRRLDRIDVGDGNVGDWSLGD